MLAKRFYLYFSFQFLKSLCNFLFISLCPFIRVKIVSLYSICHLFPIPSRISSFQLVTWINPVQSTFWKKNAIWRHTSVIFFRSQNIEEDSSISDFVILSPTFGNIIKCIWKCSFCSNWNLYHEHLIGVYFLTLICPLSFLLLCFKWILKRFSRHGNSLFTLSVQCILEEVL